MRRAVVLGLSAVLSVTLPALADEWLNARHDPQRTGRSVGRANLTAPTVRWRHYLGGSVRGDQILVRDVDADSVTDVVYVAGGKVVAKHADDTILWESELLDVRSFVGVVDLDRDNRTDLLCLGAHGAVYILAGQSGRVLWELPRALRGEVSAARVGDLDGDGREDLYVGQCLFNPVTAVGFSFSEGYAAPRELWRLAPLEDTCGTASDAIGDVDGDGQREVVLFGNRDVFRVLDGRTGRVESTVRAPDSGQFTPFSAAFLRNVDDDPALEIVLLTSGYTATTPPTGARRMAVFDSVSGPSPSYRVAWEANATDLVNANVSTDPEAIRDLDGDGAVDVAFSIQDPSSRRWTLQVRNGRTGALAAMRDNSELTGVAVVGPQASPTLFVQDDSGTLRGLGFDGRSLTERFQIPGAAVVRRVDSVVQPREAVATRTITAQLDDDTSRELLVIPFDPTLAPEARVATTVAGYDLDGPTPRRVGAFTAETGATVLTVDTGANLSRPYEQPVVVSSDGYLQALDRMLTSTNRVVTAEFTIPGMHVGGYFSGLGPTVHTPVIGRLDAPAVVVRTSKPSLVRLDARAATLARPPRTLWERPRASYPLIVDTDGDGVREVVAIDGRDIVAFDAADGQRERWRAVEAGGPRGSSILADVLPLQRRGSVGADLTFPRFDPGGVLRPTTLRGTDGALRWNTYSNTFHSGFVSFSVADVTRDGVDDFVSAADFPFVVSGGDGALARRWSLSFPYGTQVIADFLGRGEREMFFHASPSPDAIFSADRTDGLTLEGQWTDHRSYPYAALARCEDANALVTGTLSAPELWSLRPTALRASGAPADNLIRAHRVVAGGRLYNTVADIAPEVRQGTLSNLTTVADLDGMGHPGLLVGSTDGWLYALDPCTLDLRWAMNFRYPVGEPVVGDADGDGTDDVLVSAADGYLYALAARAYAPSMSVREVDPRSSTPEADVDEIETFNTLSARWDSVPGANSYQVVVRSESGTSLLLPDFSQVSSPGTTLTDLPLRLGGTYHFGVIASGPMGSSVEAASNGVTVVDRSPPYFTLSARPARFAPLAGEHCAIEVIFGDRTGLTRASAVLQRDDGTPVRRVDDTTFLRPLGSRAVRFEWDGTNDAGIFLPEGTYDLVVTATDVGGHTATDRLSVAIVAPPPDAGLRVNPFLPNDAGCGCRTGRSPAPQGLWGGMLVGIVWASRRRRRRSELLKR